jgi:omega-amidase
LINIATIFKRLSALPRINMAQIEAKPFRLALIQLGNTGADKVKNIELARQAVREAASHQPKPDLIVLPEIWNSPYAVTSFREYSEKVPEVGSMRKEQEGETVTALRELAKETGSWLIGGR